MHPSLPEARSSSILLASMTYAQAWYTSLQGFVRIQTCKRECISTHTQSVIGFFYYTSKPECAIPHTHTHRHIEFLPLYAPMLLCTRSETAWCSALSRSIIIRFTRHAHRHTLTRKRLSFLCYIILYVTDAIKHKPAHLVMHPCTYTCIHRNMQACIGTYTHTYISATRQDIHTNLRSIACPTIYSRMDEHRL